MQQSAHRSVSFNLAGWLWADLLLGMFAIFLAANALAPSADASKKSGIWLILCPSPKIPVVATPKAVRLTAAGSESLLALTNLEYAKTTSLVVVALKAWVRFAR